ncbi:MAG: ABC transporter permease [Isosphaeraceae bacterium]
MGMRVGLGPVFAFESLIAARRWQVYGLRSLYVALLLVGLMLTWGPSEQRIADLEQAARIGRILLLTVIAVQLGVVLLAAPAAAAGAVCVDKARGTLLHAFATDLTAREIVLGKLGARLGPVVGLMACGLPVLALGSFLGGIDLVAALGAELVTLGVAVVCCSVALLASVWARKPHQALLLAYTIVGAWAGAVPTAIFVFRLGPPASLGKTTLFLTNPIVAAFAPEFSTPFNPVGLLQQGLFLAVSLLVSMLLIGLASWTLRPAVLAQANRPQKRERTATPARLVDFIPGPPLDTNPILWREWHRKRPSLWTGRFWTAYAIASTLASLYVIGWYYTWWGDGLIRSGIHLVAARINAWQVAIGLLLLSVSAASALGEERDRGSLDVIMTTTLTSREIVWGKWWGTFAMVPRLAILPIWVTAGASMITGNGLGLLFMIGLILAYAAAITSVGLALATWVPRLGRVIGISVMGYILVAAGWPLLVMLLPSLPYFQGIPFNHQPNWQGLLLASPFYGVHATTDWAARWSFGGDYSADWGYGPAAISDPTWPLIWIVVYSGFALLLATATWKSFDRCMGRIPESRSEESADPWRIPESRPDPPMGR